MSAWWLIPWILFWALVGAWATNVILNHQRRRR